jgi:cell division protein FtsL
VKTTPQKTFPVTGTLAHAWRGVAGRAGIQRAGAFMAVVLCAAVLFVGLYYVWTRMQMVQIGYEISTLEQKNRQLKKRARELMLEIASLQSPGELEKKATKIGLTLPAMGNVVHVP